MARRKGKATGKRSGRPHLGKAKPVAKPTPKAPKGRPGAKAPKPAAAPRGRGGSRNTKTKSGKGSRNTPTKGRGGSRNTGKRHGSTSAPRSKRGGVKVTKHTAIHRAARDRLNKLERDIRTKLKSGKLSESTKAQLKAGLGAVEAARVQVNNNRGAAPVGATSGSESIALGEWSGNGHPDVRVFNSGEQLLGYIEGRPGVLGIIAIQPFGGGVLPDDRQPPTPDVYHRIANSPPVQEAAPEQRAAMIQALLDAYDYADYFGIEAEFDVDSDSGGGGE